MAAEPLNPMSFVINKSLCSVYGVPMQDLPDHCIVENRNEKLMVSLGLTVMMLEL